MLREYGHKVASAWARYYGSGKLDDFNYAVMLSRRFAAMAHNTQAAGR